jgi:hypothetical protein
VPLETKSARYERTQCFVAAMSQSGDVADMILRNGLRLAQ